MTEQELVIILDKMDREDIPRLVACIRQAKEFLSFAGTLYFPNGYDAEPVPIDTPLKEMADLARAIVDVESARANQVGKWPPKIEAEAARIMKEKCYSIALDVQEERDKAPSTPWGDDCREIASRIADLSHESVIPDDFYTHELEGFPRDMGSEDE